MTSRRAEIAEVESLMMEHFGAVPFHNLRLLWGEDRASAFPGGTCSDLTLSFLDRARGKGFDAHLHTGFIGGQEIHRLVRVEIGGTPYFADVGNGWPAVRLYPSDVESSFECFGMRFRSEMEGRRVRVYHQIRGKETLQLEIDVRSRPESEIHNKIAGRFTSGIQYPFSNSLRFSMIVGERFLFLRGDRLEIYGATGFDCIEGIGEGQVADILVEHFGLPALDEDR